MVSVKNVVKAFDGFRALDGLDISVPSGSVYGLVGPNGAGKTTIIRHLTGAYRQDSGDVLIGGVPIYENPEVKSRVASIPDDIFFFPSAGILDMKKYYSGLYPSFCAARFDALGKAFDLPLKQPLRRFSRGMQKQAAFWIAMSLCPDLLILDEPVDGLDPVMRRQVWGLILGDVAERGTTVFISSHNLRELEDVCDHVGVINRGKMLIERSLTELQEGTVKVQVVFPEGEQDLSSLDILHRSASGRVQMLIVRGVSAEIEVEIRRFEPLFYDLLPLSLEEVFIYELGGRDYAVKEIIL